MAFRRLATLLASALIASTALAADTALSPEVRAGLETARRLGIDPPATLPVIYVDTVAEHYTHDEQILLAWRGGDGLWRLAGGIETTGLMVKMNPDHQVRPLATLSRADSLALDRLLADRRLYRQASPPSPDLGVGAAFNTLEVVAPQGHLVIRWAGMRLRGRAGRIADILMGHD